MTKSVVNIPDITKLLNELALYSPTQLAAACSIEESQAFIRAIESAYKLSSAALKSANAIVSDK